MLEKPINKMLLFFRVIWAMFFAKTTREFYDRIADIYEMVFTSHTIHIENIVDLLTSIYFKKNCTVIDLGCGTGMLCKALIGQGFHVVGIDISLESLMVFKRSDKRVSLCQADAESLPFSDHDFQAIVCLGVWRHLSHFELVLDEICRVLNENGNFVLGYFPPKLGGVYHAAENRFSGLLIRLYNKMVRWFGYDERVDFDFEKSSWKAICKRFEQVLKIESGENWYIIQANRPKDVNKSFTQNFNSLSL